MKYGDYPPDFSDRDVVQAPHLHRLAKYRRRHRTRQRIPISVESVLVVPRGLSSNDPNYHMSWVESGGGSRLLAGRLQFRPQATILWRRWAVHPQGVAGNGRDFCARTRSVWWECTTWTRAGWTGITDGDHSQSTVHPEKERLQSTCTSMTRTYGGIDARRLPAKIQRILFAAQDHTDAVVAKPQDLLVGNGQALSHRAYLGHVGIRL